jgi:signal peptidase I
MTHRGNNPSSSSRDALHRPGSVNSVSSRGGALLRLLVDVVEAVLPAFVVALLINLFLAQGTYVHGQSMEPNLHTDQRLIVEKVSYKLHPPQRWDIAVIRVDGYDIPVIKRVIGLPGETVTIRDNQVFINGLPLQETYLPDVYQPDYGPTKVPSGHVFVLGDNRGLSSDSRVFGVLPIENVVGRAWLSYWPLEDLRLIH